MIGSNINFVKNYYIQRYNISATEVDDGGCYPYCIYGYKPYFLYKQNLLPSDLTKIGKAKSVYNRLRTTSQAGGTNRLCWTINVVSDGSGSELERTIQNLYLHKRCFDSRIYASETYHFDEQETYEILHDIIEQNKDNSSIINAISFKDTDVSTVYQNPNPYDYIKRRQEEFEQSFSNLFENLPI